MSRPVCADRLGGMADRSRLPENHEKPCYRKKEVVTRERLCRIGMKDDRVEGDARPGGVVPFRETRWI